MWHDIELGWLHSVTRRAGYVEAVMKAAAQYGPPREVRGKMYIRIHDSDYVNIKEAFNPFTESVRGYTPSKVGLGDLISKVATPIARALNMDCIDKTTGQLKPESGCAGRQRLMNKIQLPI